MTLKILSPAVALAALALGTLGAGSAVADATINPDPTAQNVTAYGTTAAWSRKAADGYHLVVAHGGIVADAPVPASSAPYDPDLGPTKANGRAIVYARGGDLYRYDVGTAAEQKLTRLSSAATEIAPSIFKDTIVFSRTDGKAPGTYVLRPKRKLTRVFRTVALETDVSETRIIGRYGKAPGTYVLRPKRKLTRVFRTVALETDVSETRIIGRYGKGTKSIIRIMNMVADDVKIVARAKAGQRLASPTLTRFNGIWLRAERRSATVEQVGVNAHRGLAVRIADRTLPGRVSSLASYRIPTLYTDGVGVQRIDPKLKFG